MAWPWRPKYNPRVAETRPDKWFVELNCHASRNLGIWCHGVGARLCCRAGQEYVTVTYYS